MKYGTASKPKKGTFPTKVNYDLSVELLAENGKYDWNNYDVSSKNFPTTRKGEADLVLELVHFNQVLTSKEVLKELDKRGLRPAETHELLSFGIKYPKEQRKYPIVALGSVWHGGWNDSLLSPCLWRDSGDREQRELSLGWSDIGWDEYYRFLAVSK